MLDDDVFDDFMKNIDSILESNDTNAGLEQNINDIFNSFKEGFGDTDDDISKEVWWTLVIIYGVVITLGLVGNLVVLYAILSKRGMRTARNYFILCLAFSDLLLCAFSMPLTLWEVLRKGIT